MAIEHKLALQRERPSKNNDEGLIGALSVLTPGEVVKREETGNYGFVKVDGENDTVFVHKSSIADEDLVAGKCGV